MKSNEQHIKAQRHLPWHAIHRCVLRPFKALERPIRPRAGSASVFPHGDCPVPLLHEGSAVTKGTKPLGGRAVARGVEVFAAH